MKRRELIASLAGVGSVGIAGCGSRPPREEPRRAEPTSTPGIGGAYRRTPSRDPATIAAAWGLDEVVDVGALRDGPEKPIGDLLDRHAVDGALLYFPAGEYRIEETFTVSNGGRIGVLGDDAVVKPPDGYDSAVLGFGYPEPLTALYVRGLTFDYRAENTGGRPILGVADDVVVFRDLSVRGVADVPEDLVRLDVTTPEGVGIVDGLSLPDGSTEPGVTGCEVGDDNHGDVSFFDCHIAGFPDNGLYADPPAGAVGVYGGEFRNNGVANVRITASDPSVVRGVRVRCDDAEAVGENMRGIRLRGGHDHLVEDCVVEMLAVPSSDGAVTIASELESATVRNCRLHVDADNVNAIRVKSPNEGAGEATREGPFRFENVRVTGAAADGAAVDASGRRNCSFRGLRIHQSGDDRDGIVTSNVEGEIVDSCVAVTNDPLALSDSRIERRNLRLNPNPREGCCCPDSPADGVDGS
ncbi:hypothetical protein B4589_016200 (plasmid) [Halolamina sp. CBA1230]|uniref:hypothetical protein n=1 Tax=Halolamina sp. CBA1230 TaxID=1853690 RepID=UPI001594A318|nr:hypothetical protein [Halolamina sp. CBA1230]QKY21953.1 hypothetical protein B4589_016200 [Halolamina sp. CBA1230]